MNNNIWFADSEVFAYDTLWCFKRASDGHKVSFWNDCDGVREFITNEQPILCGYNFRDYDSHILKATLLGWSPEDIHEVSTTIIFNENKLAVWDMFRGQGWVTLPPVIDLFHDIVPRKGLKHIEANIGMSIVESSVDFNITRPLTPDELDDVEMYCWHDVDATEQLYYLRQDYINAKIALCEIQGVDPLPMLKHTNGRIIAEVLGAVKLDELPYEEYEIPDTIDQSAVPPAVIDYVKQFNTENCTDKNAEALEFMFHDCPTKVALGGIHAAIPAYKETSTSDRVIFIQDIGSFYPSMILNLGYMSRAVASPLSYKQFYDLRMEAKAQKNVKSADASKLVLNGTYGILKDQYNKLFDPMQGTRVCLSGQLFMLDLIEQLYRNVPEGLQLIQLNTDGWVLSCERKDFDTVKSTVAEWSKRTNLTVDTDEVDMIIQDNVNNYIMKFANGKVKAKGGIVARHNGGDFKSNDMTIIDHAIVEYYLNGTPIADTINACDDVMRYQIIARCGSMYAYIKHNDTILQKVNRVFATKDTAQGGVFKVKINDDGTEKLEKVAMTPPHCLIANESIEDISENVLTQLDKQWYIELAERKAKDFVTREKKEKEIMAEVKETHNELESPKPTRKKKEVVETVEQTPPPLAPMTLSQKLLLLQIAMADVAKNVAFDGAIANINYEYADTQQYKKWLSSKCSELGLVVTFNVTCSFPTILNPESKTTMFGSMADGTITLMDVDSDEVIDYTVCGFGSNPQAGYVVGVAQTNAIRNFILNNYLLDNKGRDGDDQAMNSGENTASKTNYVSAADKVQLKQGIADAKSKEQKHATIMFAQALYAKIIEAQKINPDFCVKKADDASINIKKHFEADGTPKVDAETKMSTLLKADAVACLTLAEEIIAGA